MTRQVNNPTNWNKLRPLKWRQNGESDYLNQIENWARQVYENLTNIKELRSYTVATLPDATEFEAHILYVSDETGGATLAFSDGINWRRVQDRAVVS